MVTFLALFRGRSVGEARMICASSDAALVAFVADKLLQTPCETTDPIVQSLEAGKRRARRLVRQEAL